MKLPSNAQMKLLALVEQKNAAGLEVEWKPEPDEYRPSIARLFVERVDRDNDRARWESATGYQRGSQIRRTTVEACIRQGWLNPLHERTAPMTLGVGYCSDWPRGGSTIRQLDLTEDGVIALGLWRQRAADAGPAPLPTLSEREREIIGLAARAMELGYALCARKPARSEARRMRRDGWWDQHGVWIANSATGLVPTATAVVEVLPERADGLNAEGDLPEPTGEGSREVTARG